MLIGVVMYVRVLVGATLSVQECVGVYLQTGMFMWCTSIYPCISMDIVLTSAAHMLC